MNLSKTAIDIANSAQLSCMLEVCSYPKPGNISRFSNFKDTRFEHFLSSSVAIGPIIQKAAMKALRINLNKPNIKLNVGRYILECVKATKRWHQGGNTNLGIVTLLVPLAMGAAKAKMSNVNTDAKFLRENVGNIMMSTTPQDAIEYYRAIEILGFSGLGKTIKMPSLDVRDPHAKIQIINKEYTLYQVMGKCSGWDNICSEWKTNMHITFNIGYPILKRIYKETNDVNISIVTCYLTILAKYPDTLIARKNSYQMAENVSKKARSVLREGDILSKSGGRALRKFDKELRTSNNNLNPGTTADLTASSIMVALLQGLRP